MLQLIKLYHKVKYYAMSVQRNKSQKTFKKLDKLPRP